MEREARLEVVEPLDEPTISTVAKVVGIGMGNDDSDTERTVQRHVGR